MNIQIIPYKYNKSSIEKYHIIRLDNSQIYYKLSNILAPFGRQTEHKTNYKLDQHRLNINFNIDEVLNQDKSYIEFERIITELEIYFSNFDELKDLKLISNIIDREKFGIVIRLHLKTLHDKTITPLLQIIDSENQIVEWIQFDKDKKINIDFGPDCLWIDNKNKTFGISFVIYKVIQFIN
jgi:hypothetical protein